MSRPPRTPQSELFPPLATFYSPTSPASIRDHTPVIATSAGAGTAPFSSSGSRTSPIAALDPPPFPALKQTLSATAVTTISSSTRDTRPSLARKPASFSAPRPSSAGTAVTSTEAPPPLPPGRARAAAVAAVEAANGSANAAPLTAQTNMPHKQQQQQQQQHPPPINTRDRDRGERDFDQIRSATSDDSFARVLTRTTTSTSMAQQVPPLPPPTPVGGASASTNGGGSFWQPGDGSTMHQQIIDQANKRISTFDYLRKVHEGRVHWFNAYLFDRPDLARMPSLDQRKLARRATNYLLLGLSLPVINDLYSASAVEFLRSLSALLSEFDSFQQLRNDSSSSASLARARLPNMFRRPGGRGRRSTSATDSVVSDSMSVGGGGILSGGGGPGGAASSANGGANVSSSVRNFAASESELLPGEEYSYLLTPALPFEPDYFETFATLCDVLIECYSRFLSLVASPRDCNASVAELFTKADARVRKILVQNIAKEFEDSSRSNIKSEIAGIGKTVLSGLM